MRLQQVGRLKQKWSKNYSFKTMVNSAGAFGVTVLFALYHGILGRFLSSIWHGSICVFYLLLAALRGIILLSEYMIAKQRGKEEEKKQDLRKKVFFGTAVLLFLLNVALILPISLMVRLQKPVNMGKIPAIAMAAYTTYKITIAVIHTRKRTVRNMLIRELTTINLIDALVSILTLQNTLIMVNASPGEGNSMLAVSASSSAAIYVTIIVITLRLFFNVKKEAVHTVGK